MARQPFPYGGQATRRVVFRKARAAHIGTYALPGSLDGPPILPDMGGCSGTLLTEPLSQETLTHRPESACSVGRSANLIVDHVSREGHYMRGEVLLRSLMLVIVMMLFVAACSDERASGPITIETSIATSQPVVGTFEVTEGADTLG